MKTLRKWLWLAVRFVLLVWLGVHLVCVSALILLRWFSPPTTAVQVQRRAEAFLSHRRYVKRSQFVPLRSISLDFQHAVIAAEDGRFYEHHGFDWLELRKVVAKNIEDGKLGRGASTITQQLVKNLFLTTSRSFVRKAFEFTLTPVTELILPKPRILELYLNVIEWGPGVYGAEAAATRYYNVSASSVSREQAARMAAIIPSPLRWRPARMDGYATEIMWRMSKMGW